MWGWLRRLWHSLFPPRRLPVPGGDGAQTLDVSGRPRKPHHRRSTVRDPRLLPGVRTLKHAPRLAPADAPRLFAATLRTRSRDLRTLATDDAQLARFDLPVWFTEAELAYALDVPLGTLRHFAIHRNQERQPHYVTFAIPKRSGGERLICAPKQRLKQLQRLLLRELVGRLPVHHAAHGFVPGRSIASAAAPHVGRAVIVRVDLEDFFGTVTFPRVRGFLVALGYGYEVATVLAVLLTEAPRQPVALEDGVVYVPVGPRHCVQGAPTSPALCNALVHKLDRRLAGLAHHLGFAYTRYADDLTFSSDDPGAVGRLLGAVQRIVRSEGFRVRADKTRVQRRGRRQQVCGVTVNETLGLSRRERRRLRARIHHEGRARAEGRGSADEGARIEGLLAYLSMLSPEQAAPLKARWQAVR